MHVLAAVYFCTEDVFPVKRLHQMSYYFEQKYGIKNTLDNVYISHISDYVRNLYSRTISTYAFWVVLNINGLSKIFNMLTVQIFSGKTENFLAISNKISSKV